MDKPTKKLVLSTETISALDDRDLANVVGGATGICVDTVVCNSGICNSGAVCDSAVCQSGIIC